MQLTTKIQKLFKNEILISTFLFFAAILLIYLAYQSWGKSFVDDIYNERSLPFLNEILEGRDSHSLEFYYTRIDVLAHKVFLCLCLVPFLYALTVLWIKKGGPDEAKSVRVLIFAFPILLLVLLIYMKAKFGYEDWLAITLEDGIVEYLTSIIYFIAFWIALSIAIRFMRTNYMWYAIMYFVLSGGLLFISIEEISWGQRIVGIETPEALEKHNYQGELNLHNLLSHYSLYFFYILIGFYGAFSRILLPSRYVKRYPLLVNLMTPNHYLFMYFFPAFALYTYYSLKNFAVDLFGPQAGFGPWEEGYFLSRTDEEPIELILSLGFLLFVVINRYRQVSPGVESYSRAAQA